MNVWNEIAKEFYWIKKYKETEVTNNPKKIDALKAMGVVVNERVPLSSNPNKYNEKYIDTKIKKLGHLL